MLKRVSIQNFKSLKDVTLDLQKVNLLIGPNNSGKTNFLKALEGISKSISGYGFFTVRDQYKREIENILQIRLVYPSARTDNKFNHIFTHLKEVEGNDESEYYAVYVSHDDTFEMNDPSAFIDEIIEEEFQKNYGSFNIYKPDPNKIIQPGIVGAIVEKVNDDASNLVGFLDLMLGKYRRTVFSRIEADLHVCVPEFDEINLDNVISSDKLKEQFGDKSFKRLGLTNGRQGVTYWADELSEGTLYFITLLCIINQPNPPKLLLLEEPEKGIHPRRIYEIIQFIFRLAEDKDIQVIMTTHSPIVLDMFKDMPESVFIFDKDEEGATQVKNLQRDVIEPDTERSKEYGLEPPHYTDALGDSWTIGFLGGVPK